MARRRAGATAIVSFLGDLLLNIADRSRALVGLRRAAPLGVADILRLADALMSNRGEASGVALARDILSGYAALSEADKTAVLIGFAEGFGPPMDRLKAAAEAFLAEPDPRRAAAVFACAEPRRQELVRRLNLAPGATYALVLMRADLLERKAAHPALAAFDEDFVHLFSAWFNRGFLVLRQIQWSSPASILEKIIRYEAVHAIAGWDDLRRRLEPQDRRLFAFFHPALADEPLIFVEVALTDSVPAAIQPLLEAPSGPAVTKAPTTAVFYSISNAQKGLAGISFGNFLIKQVVEDLKRETPGLTTFVTLSPAPGFAAWLAEERAKPASDYILPEDARALALLDKPGWAHKSGAAEAVERALAPIAAAYFLRARTPSGKPVDPVARFHLGNGARLDRLNPLGDRSPRGLAQSHGLMVNYRYELAEIEQNHEAFAARGEIAASSAVRKLLRGKSVASDLLASLS